MIAPFAGIGILFVTSALLWARHKGQVSDKEVGIDTLERGGDE